MKKKRKDVKKKKDDESAELMNTSFTCMTCLYLMRKPCLISLFG